MTVKLLIGKAGIKLIFFAVIFFIALDVAAALDKFSLVKDLSWLKQHYQNPSVLLIDSRNPDDYLQGHIPGAVNLPTEEIIRSKQANSGADSLNLLRKLINSAGLHGDLKAVIYGSDLKSTAYLLWLFQAYGHVDAVFIQESFDSWVAAKMPVENGQTIKQSAEFIPMPDKSRIATKFNTRVAALGAKRTIVDVRSQDQFYGREGNTGKKGHIPSAMNIPIDSFFLDNGQLKSLSSLKQLFYRLNKRIPVIVYSNYGRNSALAYVVLSELGYKVSNYQGGWYDWSNDHTLPTE